MTPIPSQPSVPQYRKQQKRTLTRIPSTRVLPAQMPMKKTRRLGTRGRMSRMGRKGKTTIIYYPRPRSRSPFRQERRVLQTRLLQQLVKYNNPVSKASKAPKVSKTPKASRSHDEITKRLDRIQRKLSRSRKIRRVRKVRKARKGRKPIYQQIRQQGRQGVPQQIKQQIRQQGVPQQIKQQIKQQGVPQQIKQQVSQQGRQQGMTQQPEKSLTPEIIAQALQQQGSKTPQIQIQEQQKPTTSIIVQQQPKKPASAPIIIQQQSRSRPASAPVIIQQQQRSRPASAPIIIQEESRSRSASPTVIIQQPRGRSDAVYVDSLGHSVPSFLMSPGAPGFGPGFGFPGYPVAGPSPMFAGQQEKLRKRFSGQQEKLRKRFAQENQKLEKARTAFKAEQQRARKAGEQAAFKAAREQLQKRERATVARMAQIQAKARQLEKAQKMAKQKAQKIVKQKVQMVRPDAVGQIRRKAAAKFKAQQDARLESLRPPRPRPQRPPPPTGQRTVYQIEGLPEQLAQAMMPRNPRPASAKPQQERRIYQKLRQQIVHPISETIMSLAKRQLPPIPIHPPTTQRQGQPNPIIGTTQRPGQDIKKPRQFVLQDNPVYQSGKEKQPPTTQRQGESAHGYSRIEKHPIYSYGTKQYDTLSLGQQSPSIKGMINPTYRIFQPTPHPSLDNPMYNVSSRAPQNIYAVVSGPLQKPYLPSQSQMKLRQQINQLKSRLEKSPTPENVTTLQEKLAAMEAQLTVTLEQLKAMTAAAKGSPAAQAVAAVSQPLKNLTEEHSNLQAELERLKTALAATQAQGATTKSQLQARKDVAKQLAEVRAKFEHLDRLHAMMEIDFAGMAHKLTTTQARHLKQMQQLARSKRDLLDSVKQYTKTTKDIITNNDGFINELRQSERKLLNLITKLSTQRDNLEKERVTTIGVFNTDPALLESIKQQSKSKGELIKILTTELDAAKQFANKLHKRNEEHEKVAEQAKAKLAELQQAKSQLERTASSGVQQMSKLDARNAELQNNLEQIKKTIARLIQENNDLKQENEDGAAVIEELNQDLAKARSAASKSM